jgi:sugar lactone lactonase YvrE
VDVLQGRKTGMLLEYDPKTKQTVCLADGFWYSNGIALPPDDSYILVVETVKLSIVKHWLTGPMVRPEHAIDPDINMHFAFTQWCYAGEELHGVCTRTKKLE